MNIAILYSRANLGIEAPLVTIEVHLSAGLPSLSIVGLPETAIKESKERVRSALLTAGFAFPTRRIVINLAPADLPKREGGRFDLPIALGILAASGQLPTTNLADYEFAGELALDGQLRAFSGTLTFALATSKSQRQLILPIQNAWEASLAQPLTIFAATHLLEICAHLHGQQSLTSYQPPISHPTAVNSEDLLDIRGQQQAKRALEIAATGGHSLLLIGPPGSGKTMLASRLISILPTLTRAEALEVAAINSIAGKSLDPARWQNRAFRAPHHTTSAVGLVGGANPPKPGEVTLAHHGVLFLDELPEFQSKALESLREPLEAGTITITRAAYQLTLPTQFQLIAAMNPCPCGYYGAATHNCHCSYEQIKRYQQKISGPLLDRLDLLLTIPAISQQEFLQHTTEGENSATVKARVLQARTQAIHRAGKINSLLTTQEIERYCLLAAAEQQYLLQVFEQLKLSMRSYYRLLKIARTIADLTQTPNIQRPHIQEAVSYCRGLFINT